MAKILISPGYGGGWSSWHYGDKEQQEYMLRYQPLIDALERGEDVGYDDSRQNTFKPFKPGSVLEKFYNDFVAKFGEDNTPYLGGARDLTVTEVNLPFRIAEYDGNESVEEFSMGSYFDPNTWDEIIEGECEEERPQLESGDIEV